MAKAIDEHRAEILEQKWTFNVAGLMAKLRSTLKFADTAKIKARVDETLLEMLGPKTSEDLKKKVRTTTRNHCDFLQKVEPKQEKVSEAATEPIKELITFPDPSENKQLR